MFGVQLASGGSASMANQIVIHTEIQELAREVVRFLENNKSAASQVTSIHDMMHTIVTSQKKGLEAWQQTVVSNLNDWKKDLKQEQKEKKMAQDGEINKIKTMLQQLLSDKIEVAESTENGLRKRKSEQSEEQVVAKMAKPGAELTPADRYKAAAALAKERRQKLKFACILCVMNDHKTVACEAYGSTAARKGRMAELGICTTCGRNHVGQCKFDQSKQCDLCGNFHLKYLCPTTFD
ncbi:hypothetical protein CAEBREN_05770 [Caenorhabditis brenneri]|uniref:Uncharacterized protein n=1 Tax=Caenorhabditis brenneri TaxID=135651 RepID=G0N6D9_CAEBE|nr:hypothetical protein CAEBREN_05770 [Caenorhabditis brenneri]